MIARLKTWLALAGGLCFGHAWRVFMGRCQTEIKPEDPRFKSAAISASKHKGD